jgi:aryl-alcohol dehydrogenase-like predicted oxidoreductase
VKAIAAARNVTPAQISLAWLLSRPGVTAPILGARDAGQLEENLNATQVELNAEELRRLDDVSRTAPEYPYRTYKRTIR